MMTRTQELCRKLKPVLGRRIDGLWAAYLAESDPGGKSDIEQTLELLAARHLGQGYQPDRAPFPPPSRDFAAAGDLPLGQVSYGTRDLYPVALHSDRLKEHVLVAGRSGSGKTNLTFVLAGGLMDRGIHVLALDWKRGYRDLLNVRSDLLVYTIGREVSPFRFNPFIPPPGCEPNVWIKLIVDVIASAYLGGEGVISLFVAGLDHLFREAGIFDGTATRWPTVLDLLAWLRTNKLRGRAAMWQASAERILLAMTYGEFGAVLNTQDNGHLRDLLNHNVVLEMDGLSSASDRVMFSEAITLYLYRYRLAQGPRDALTNVIVLEEAHNLLAARQPGTRETVLETSIRMIRQYGLGYLFVDQSASLLSKVAFANSYATIALSQKLRGDVQAIAGAMNLTDEQKQALTTLPIGSAVVRLADEHPEPFLVRVPRSPVREGSVSDTMIRARMGADSRDSGRSRSPPRQAPVIPVVPSPDEKHQQTNIEEIPHPPDFSEGDAIAGAIPEDPDEKSPPIDMSREAIRFLEDVAARPLSTTVTRYGRLHLSRRRGNAIRRDLLDAGIIEAVQIATRSGQVVLYQISDAGRALCVDLGIDPPRPPRPSLEHRYWFSRTAAHLKDEGYDVWHEEILEAGGAVDLVAERAGERIAVEIETGKSDIRANVSKVITAGFDRLILVATSPSAVTACRRVVDALPASERRIVELQTWLDIP